MEKAKKNQLKKYISWGCIAAAVLFLAVMPLLAAPEEETDGPKASILSGTVQTGSLEAFLRGGGNLTAVDAEDITLPSGVKITEFLVENGDTVTEGTPLASVDKVSLMSAIVQVQDTLEYLRGEMVDVKDDTVSSYINATAGGRVKEVYAQAGESVQEVMLRDGALAVLSLDSLMAVKIERNMPITTGETVCVTFPDDTEVSGRVESNLNGEIVITIDDEGYAIGEKVTVTTEDGDRVGSGGLYVHNAWTATGFTGTISTVNATEESTVYAGSTLFTLTDTDFTAELETLAARHREYEELLLEMFQMYQSGAILAPCDGLVSGIDEDSVHLLSGGKDNWVLTLLGGASEEEETGFIAFAAQVTGTTPEGMALNIDPTPIRLSSLHNLCSTAMDTAAMTEQLTYTGSTDIYTQTSDGLLLGGGTVSAGERLLFVGDEEGVRWIVNADRSAASTVSHTQGGVYLSLLSADITICTGDENCEVVGEHLEDCPKNVCSFTKACAANEDVHEAGCAIISCTMVPECTNAYHKDGCLSICTGNGDTCQALTGHLLSCYHSCTKTESCPATAHDKACILNCTKTQACSAENHYNECPKASYTVYTGYLAQVTEVSTVDNKIKLNVNQTPAQVTETSGGIWNFGTLDVGNPENLLPYPDYFPVENAEDYSVGDTVVLVYDEYGQLYAIPIAAKAPTPEVPGGTGIPGTGDMSGLGDLSGMAGMAGMSGFGDLSSMMSGMSGMSGLTGGTAAGQAQEVQLYDLDGSTLMTVTPQESMSLTITLDEQDISKISAGQAAEVKVDALRGEVFAAEVTEVAISGTNSGGSSKFTAELTVPMAENMLAGMSATVSIPLYTKMDILTIPVAALVENGTQTQVYTALDEETGEPANPVTVTVGISDGEMVEILSGLHSGDTFYYSYYDTLELSTEVESGFGFGG